MLNTTKTRLLPFFLWGIILFAFASCNSAGLQSGDLLFVGSVDSDLSEAIDQVTKTDANTSFSHMGIVQINNNEIWVLHASPEQGVVKESLANFRTNNAPDGAELIGYRINGLTTEERTVLLQQAEPLLGQPYNWTYVLEDEGYYCSEFVYTVFESAAIFTLEPMTFKDPATDSFPATWIKHYEDLNQPIPEGLPGCNPNGMASNSRLQLLGTF